MEIANQASHVVSPSRLWFGFAGSAAAWVAMGVTDILITWQSCLHKEQYGGAHLEPGFRVLYAVCTIALFVIAVVAGIVSYHNWRTLSAERNLAHAEGRRREEYMALAGVFISITLGIGIIWLGIPIGILDLCARAR